MLRPPHVVALVTLTALGLLFGAAPGDAQIPWRSGSSPDRSLDPAEVAAELSVLLARGREHAVVQLTRELDAELRASLAAVGIRILDFLGDRAFFAGIDADSLDPTALEELGSLRDVQAIERQWKLHPLLARADYPAWSVVGTDALGGRTLALYVKFHRDVDLETASTGIVERGGTVVSPVVSVNSLVVEIPESALPGLADDDRVQWIEPPLPPLSTMNDSNRILTQANTAQSPPYDLDGSGVRVMVFDGGTAFAGHPDFGGRMTIRDSDGLSNHATHVSGTIGGSGADSGGTFRGMAPGVFLESYGFEWGPGGIFLYTNPGDIEQDYGDAINNVGADIANNSIGTNTATNGFPCEITGDYGITSALIDSIVIGSLGDRFRIVWANGNERQSPNCGDTYYTTAPPACAKNHITVGALNSNDESMTSFSSWGPADDGRLKPDLSSLGCQSNGDNGVTSCSSSGGYWTACGTSMATPTVTGLSSLIIEDYRAQFPGAEDPDNATLKALLAHTAEDLGNPGPDYQFGYGSVRVQDAIDFMRTGQFLEATVSQGEGYLLQLSVPPGTPELRVTVAWDDHPGTPNVIPSLVNDLDLIVHSPSAVRAFPWTLDPASPASNATQDQEDHLNNIEQVVVLSPESGVWEVEILGLEVPEGPQRFSVCASSPFTTFNISLPNGAPTLLEPGIVTEVDVVIEGSGETVVPGTETLHYRDQGGAFQTFPLTLVSGSLYRASLPAALCSDTPEFYFSAEGNLYGARFNPAGAPASVHSAEVGTIEVFFQDDLETDLGWTGGVPGDTATTGVWTRVDPIGTSAQPEDDHSDPGTICWVTGQGSVGGSIGENDVDGGHTTLLTPILDLAGQDDATVSYWRWFSNDQGANPNDDIFVIDISNNGGGSWTNVETIGPTGPGTGGGWIQHSFRVGDVIAATSQMQMRFIAADEGAGGSIVEVAVDDFEVTGFSCDLGCSTPLFIRGDANGSGGVNIADASYVLSHLFESGPAPDPLGSGDANGDGGVDVSDAVYLLDFLFNMGPPPPAPYPDPGCGD